MMESHTRTGFTEQRKSVNGRRAGDTRTTGPIMPRCNIVARHHGGIAMLPTMVAAVCALVLGQAAHAASWDNTLAEARGQTVYWHAWGGDPQINDYIEWVGDQVEARHGINLVHVKLTDTAEAVARVVAEKAAGRTEDGAVDLVWINGENFASMKAQDLLFGPFAEDLPSFRYVDTKGKPTTLVDFTVPTDGLEAPWGMAQFVFFHDTATLEEPPRSIPDLLDWAKAHSGRFTYPAPPDFIGTTFLKHVLVELTDHQDALEHRVEQADFAAVTAPVWQWLEEVRPYLWRKGESFPPSGPALHQLLDDGEVDFSMAFNPAEASREISAGRLPETVRTEPHPSWMVEIEAEWLRRFSS